MVATGLLGQGTTMVLVSRSHEDLFQFHSPHPADPLAYLLWFSVSVCCHKPNPPQTTRNCEPHHRECCDSQGTLSAIDPCVDWSSDALILELTDITKTDTDFN